jgi:hypothetical protein
MKNIHLLGSIEWTLPDSKMDTDFLAVVFLLQGVGKEGLEPSRLSAHDPKSCLSANSSTSPGCTIAECGEIISQTGQPVNDDGASRSKEWIIIVHRYE